MKEQLRKNVNNKLQALDEKELLKKSKSLSVILKEFLKELKIPENLVGCYAPILREPLWYLNFDERDFVYSIPSIRDDLSMTYRKVSLEKIREVGAAFGNHEGLELVEPRVLLVPGVAFSASGKRLGRGKGYYDRYLVDRDVLKIGLCFQEQLLPEDEMIIDSFDINMDYIIKENTVIKGNR